MSFCTRCGRPLTEGSAFCTGCGASSSPAEDIAPAMSANPGSPFAPLAAPLPATPPQTAAPQPYPEPALVQPSPKKGGHSLLFTVVGVILIALITVAAGLVYAGYKVKQKTTAFIDQATSSGSTDAGNAKNADGKPNASPPGDSTVHQDDDVDQGLNAIGNIADKMGFGGPPPDPYSDLEVIKKDDPKSAECPSASTLAPADVVKPTAGRIPLRDGLIVTTTWGRKPGDVDESIATSIHPEALSASSSGLAFAHDDDTKGNFESSEGNVCAVDLNTSHAYITELSQDRPRVIPGLTRQVLSAAAF